MWQIDSMMMISNGRIL